MIHLHHASMIDWLVDYTGEPFDACVTDPPYELGFMGKSWDSTGVAFQVETWRRVYDALKPGAHLVAFSGTRTYHRMACAIEDAGFEIRDCLFWHYGSGFPKSHDVSKAIDKAAGIWRGRAGAITIASQVAKGTEYERTDKGAPATPEAERWQGWGTALKPATEPICLARKPLAEKTIAANVLAHGTGALNVDACRVEGVKPQVTQGINGNASSFNVAKERRLSGDPHEGRWPANLCHDGSDEVLAGFPYDTQARGNKGPSRSSTAGVVGFDMGDRSCGDEFNYDNGGSAARFFYSAKAGPLDRLGTAHATVKPVDLMRWLCRLITPPGGHILEPFAGSGTTGIAAKAEGFACTMIELEAEHVADIERKLAFLRGEGGVSVIEKPKARIDRTKPDKAGPLFGGKV